MVRLSGLSKTHPLVHHMAVLKSSLHVAGSALHQHRQKLTRLAARLAPCNAAGGLAALCTQPIQLCRWSAIGQGLTATMGWQILKLMLVCSPYRQS